jgi:hypothetical protein
MAKEYAAGASVEALAKQHTISAATVRVLILEGGGTPRTRA